MFTIGMDVICTNKTYKYIIDVCSTGYLSCYNEIFLMLNFKPYLVAQYLLPLTHTGPYSTEQSKLTDNNNDSTEPAFVFSENELKEIIFGSLLGDGSLEKSLKSKNARFKFSQTIKAKDYFLQLYSIFKPFFTPNYSFANYNYLDKRTDNSYTTLSFTTRALPLFTEFYSQFYFNNIKQAPDSLILLTPLALAHWITQDGSFHKGSKGIYLCTDNFKASDTIRLATYLTDKFGLKCTTHKAPKGSGEESLRIYISATSLKLVQTLVSKHMHPSFLYKIGL